MTIRHRHHIIVIIAIVMIVIVGICIAANTNKEDENYKAKPNKELKEEAERGKKAFDEGNLVDVLNNYLDFIRKAGQQPELYGQQLVDAYFYTGLVYAYYHDINSALECNLKAYKIARRTNYNDHIVSILTNIAAAYQEFGKFNKAIEYNNKLLELKVHRQGALCYYYITSGEIKAKTHKGGSPIDDWLKAYSYVENGHVNDKANILNYIASYYGSIGNDSLELQYLKKSYGTSLLSHNPQTKMSSARAILNYYMKNGNEKKSMEYGKIYLELLDSSMNAKKFMEAKSSQEKYEQQKAKKDIENLSITISKQRLITYIAISALIVVLVILTIIIYQSRKTHAAYQALYKMNIKMMDKADTKERTDNKAKTRSSDESMNAVTTSSQQSTDLYKKIEKLMEDPNVYCSPDFGLLKLTTMVDSNTTYVSKVINEHFGQNVRSFINTYRINEARRRISDVEHYGNLTIQAIAESVGYSTQVNFNRAFKQITGMTPSVFQKLAIEDNER